MWVPVDSRLRKVRGKPLWGSSSPWFDEHCCIDTAGGLGRHLGVTSCTLLIVGCIIGTGIFSTPSSILSGVGSIGASLMLWVLGFVLSFCGLFIWLEFGTMYPRSGGEKVYLEAVYQRPKYLVTVVFAANAIFLVFSAGGCIVSARWACVRLCLISLDPWR